MKIRDGFVSNSSSSSFIVSLKAYKDVFDLAKEMIKIRDAENGFTGWECTEKDLRQRFSAYEKTFDKNHPVSFKTVNEDTFIARTNEGYFVTTCNNYDWSSIKEKSWKDDLGKQYSAAEMEDVQFDLPTQYDFLFLESGLIGHIGSWDGWENGNGDWSSIPRYCEECFEDYIILQGSGKNICPKCRKEPKS